MRRIVFTFNTGMELAYVLNGANTTLAWFDLIQRATTDQLLRTEENHRHGFATLEEVGAMFTKLNECVVSLGLDPLPVLSRPALNALHGEFLRSNRSQRFHTVNLLIHWLEYELDNLQSGRGQYLFNLDFNHTGARAMCIHEEDTALFSPTMEFGTLHLHYAQIGRHFLEMATSNDQVATEREFVPQTMFTATCGLVFSEPQDVGAMWSRFEAYYRSRGGQSFFKNPFSPARLRVGFMQLGRLETAEAPTKAKREELRRALTTAHITGWRAECH